jgi:arginine deiminase
MRAIARPSATARLGVGSDVDPLGAVLLHRPGVELGAVPDGAPRRALFAAAPDPEGARGDHDVLAATLRDAGVEVLYLEALLADLAALPEGRRTARALAAALPALPNLMYVRDSSFWIGTAVVPGTMREPVRRREAALLEAVYALHPRFAGAAVRPRSRPPVEGGDVHAVGGGRVLVGISERTDAAGARRLAAWLLATSEAGVQEVVTVTLPAGAGFHLDLVLSMVDHETFAVWAPVRDRLRAHRWRRRRDGAVDGGAVDDPLAGARVIALDGDDARDHGRAWDHGANLLALAPGVVIAYDDDRRANERLRRHGVEVLEVPGRHLAAGRGGPRCLTCPVARG